MIKKIVTFTVVVLLLAVAGVLGIRSLAMSYLSQPLGVEAPDVNRVKPLMLSVASGDHAPSITRRVNDYFDRNNDALDYRLAQLFIRVDHLQAGVYEITTNDSWRSVWEKLKTGAEKQFQVTLIEGHRFQEWLQKLQQQPYLDTVLTVQNLSRKLPFLQHYPSPEGLFLPETYSYRAHTTDVALLQQAYDAMQVALQRVWAQRDRSCPLDSPYELLILASIIEKETGVSGERAMVASVFCNRLADGMRLQSDPTTIYGIANFDGNLTRQHLRENTPYNTYRIDGLPPTPIAMVSLASLEAAAQPAQSDYYYFVADNSGGHVFSKTLAEHNQAVRDYQIKPNQQDRE